MVSDYNSVFGGIPVTNSVTGGDWIQQALDAAVKINSARYAAKYAASIAQQDTARAAVPQDGNPNAVTGMPGLGLQANQQGLGLQISSDMMIAGAAILGVVLLALAFE